MTKKLYYENAYIRSFVARVLEVTSTDEGYDVVLDETAFFPEEGGQSLRLARSNAPLILTIDLKKCNAILPSIYFAVSFTAFSVSTTWDFTLETTRLPLT